MNCQRQLLLIPSLLFIINTSVLSMPPLHGGAEPLYPSGVNIGNRSAVMRDDADLEGEWNCLIILIDFSDYPFDNQNDDNFPNAGNPYTSHFFEDMLFTEGVFQHPGSASNYTGSMRDYYNEISGGVFTTVGIVTDWLRAPEPLSYYCNNDGEAGTNDDYGFGFYPNNVQKLVEDALEAADGRVNFANFDNDDDGIVDALFIVHAGPGAEAIAGDAGASYIWSHKWSIEPQERDGKWISVYSMEPEDGAIGVYCHEFGHVLGLPDLYDTDGSSEGIGEWCLMGSGGWCYRPGDPAGTCPAHMCAWSKMKLNWASVNNVDRTLEEETIMPVESTGIVYRLWTRGEDSPEFFLLENRQRIGFDAGLTRRQMEYNLPAPEGLLILHIDDNVENNKEDAHRKVDVEEASPVFTDGEPFEQLDSVRVRPADTNLYNPNRGDNGDLWPGFSQVSDDSTDWSGDRDRDEFSYFTTPTSIGYSGEPSLVSVRNVHFGNDDAVIADLSVSARVFAYFSDWNVDDQELGNGNGIPEPGETFKLFLSIRNIGEDTLAPLVAMISTESPYVGDLRMQGAEYPSLAPGEESWPAEPFVITLSADTPNRARILFVATAYSGRDILRLTFTLEIRPAHEWTKYESNPVFRGVEGEWDAAAVISPAVIVEGDTLKMWYVGLDSTAGNVLGGPIGYAWSTDGGMSWERYGEPVLTPEATGWVTAFGGIGVMSNEDGYAMAFINSTEDEMQASIGLAYSDNGVDWVSGEAPVITGGEGWAASLFTMGQVALFSGGDVYLLGFAGMTAEEGLSVGFAQSEDWMNWEVSDAPYLTPTANEANFDGLAVLSPDVRLDGEGIFNIIYSGLGGDFIGRLGMATGNADDVIRHTGTETGGSILEPGGDGSFGETWILGGRLFNWQGQQRLLFSGLTENGGAIGLALPESPQAAPNIPPAANLPQILMLDPAYPNPFNGTTTIAYQLPAAGMVRAQIYDLSGRLVVNFGDVRATAGEHRFTWNAGAMPSGVYLIRLASGRQQTQGRMVLVK